MCLTQYLDGFKLKNVQQEIFHLKFSRTHDKVVLVICIQELTCIARNHI